jgi:hypothetical protein
MYCDYISCMMVVDGHISEIASWRACALDQGL